MRYTKHQIVRIRDLNEDYFEVVVQRRGLKFQPGDAVTLYNGPEEPIFIASGVQEVWCRLILDKETFSSNFPPGTCSVRLNLELFNPLNSLLAEERPAFILTSECIGPFLSFTSTFPQHRLKVCYLGPAKIQEEWISQAHTLIKNVSKMKRTANRLYVMGNKELLDRKAKKLLKVCKQSYLV